MIKKPTDKAFWTAVNPVAQQYPWLNEDIECEVAVIGCGVTAALCALRFAKAGYDTVMVGASPVGFGGTSLSSGMMSIDGEHCLTSLVEEIGADRAMMAVDLMQQAVGQYEQLCGSMEDNCGFKRMDSLRYAADKRNEEHIRREYSLRLHNGIDAELLSAQTAAEQFTFPLQAGVYSKGVGAQIDPYRFVQAVAKAAAQEGVRIYENTGVNVIDKSDPDTVSLECAWGHTIKAPYVIVAAGLETERQCGGMERTATVYTVVTEPLTDFSGWRGPCLIHNEEIPEIYLTVTPDNRILIGGLGSVLLDERGRMAGIVDMSAIMQKRYEQLEKRLHEMFPAIRNMTVEYVYSARTGRTGDGLPVLGRLPDEDRIAYALCCGDDGLLYSEIASRLLLEQYQGKCNQQMGLFSPMREWRVKH